VSETRRLFSICIPAYNRARYLPELLDSILTQDFQDYEIVVCEDQSPERERIAAIVHQYQSRYPEMLRFFENEQNLGYDANIRNLVQKASGIFCFFMGNDDIMCAGALRNVASIIRRFPNAGVILKSYGLFTESPRTVTQEIRWFKEETEFAAGIPAIRFAFRRSGVISGYIVHRDSANASATDKFDGTLYYQMHLTANVLVDKTAACTPKVLVLCREGLPEFGSAAKEKGKYVPGRYSPQARLNMIAGALSIVRDLKQTRGIDVVEDVIHDYANYFYPYIKDQLNLPLRDYFSLYRAYGRMGFSRYPMYHVYFVLGYLLGERRFDSLTAMLRKQLGRSPRLGNSYYIALQKHGKPRK
jgi:abequosyltransferase